MSSSTPHPSFRSSFSSNSIIASNSNSKLSSSSTSSSTAPAAATQACAACKYQRRRCRPDCPLAPYFPPHKQRQFLNAHRLFGVSNILKIVRALDPPARDKAMASVIFQSDARAADPVGGCYRMIQDLHRQIDHCQMELSLVLNQLELCRAAAAQTEPAPNPPPPPDLLASSGVDQQQFFDYFYCDGDQESGGGNVGFDVNAVVGEDGGESGLGMEMQMQSFQQKGEGEEDEIRPLMEMFGVVGGEEDEGVPAAAAAAAAAASVVDVDGFFYSTETAEPRDEPNSMEQVQEHDLKEAASLFTLTNCNTSTI